MPLTKYLPPPTPFRPPAFLPPRPPGSDAFKQAFVAKWGSSITTLPSTAAQAYDSIYVLNSAFKASKGKYGASLAKKLHKVSMMGATGMIAFDEYNGERVVPCDQVGVMWSHVIR